MADRAGGPGRRALPAPPRPAPPRPGTLLEQVIHRDRSPGTIAALLPVLRQIADAAQGSDDEIPAGLLVARALENIDPDASARQLRSLLTAAVERGDYSAASAISVYLIDNYRRAGRLTEALTLAGEKADYTRRAGLGPWTQLQDERIRLQILNQQGHADQVLAEVTRLRQQIAELPEQSDQPEAAPPYNVRETILDTGRDAALQLGRWEDALALNAEILESKEHRGASAFEIARNRFNDYGPLLRLGRIAEARSLLLDCREIDEREHNTQELGTVLSALADVEDEAGHGQDAIDLERNALRYMYLAGEVDAIAASHHNLGNYLARHAADHPQALAHHLASALLRSLTGIEGADRPWPPRPGTWPGCPTAPPPRRASARCAASSSEVPGVHLDRLLTQLADPAAVQDALDALLTQARAQADPNAQLRRASGGVGPGDRRPHRRPRRR